MKKIIERKIKQEQIDLEGAWAGYRAEDDPFYQDLYLADISKATEEISRLESLLLETGELENKLPL